MDRIVHRATEAVLARPELRQRAIAIHADGDMNGVFDPGKMERAFFNLVLNASEATADRQGQYHRRHLLERGLVRGTRRG